MRLEAKTQLVVLCVAGRKPWLYIEVASRLMTGAATKTPRDAGPISFEVRINSVALITTHNK